MIYSHFNITRNISLLAAFTGCVLLYNSCRSRAKLTRSAVMLPRLSSWKYLYKFGDDQSFLVVTGMSRSSFARLHRAIFGNYIPARTHRSMDSIGKLGMILVYLGSRMTLAQMSLVFGTVPSVASDIINQMLDQICHTLKRHHAARIKFPCDDELETYAQLIHQREPTVTNVVGFIDGLSIPVECSEDVEEQAKYYNGYHHDTMINNVFAFAPTGKIIHAIVLIFHVPGMIHKWPLFSFEQAYRAIRNVRILR